MPLKVKALDLRLGDIVSLGDGYMTATVVNVDEQGAHLIRPFVHTGDFSYTGGVLWYLGIEEVCLHFGDREYDVVERGKELR